MGDELEKAVAQQIYDELVLADGDCGGVGSYTPETGRLGYVDIGEVNLRLIANGVITLTQGWLSRDR